MRLNRRQLVLASAASAILGISEEAAVAAAGGSTEPHGVAKMLEEGDKRTYELLSGVRAAAKEYLDKLAQKYPGEERRIRNLRETCVISRNEVAWAVVRDRISELYELFTLDTNGSGDPTISPFGGAIPEIYLSAESGVVFTSKLSD